MGQVTLYLEDEGIGEISKHLLSTPLKETGIPAIVLYELAYGIAKSTSSKKRKPQLKELCRHVNIPMTFLSPEQHSLVAVY